MKTIAAALGASPDEGSDSEAIPIGNVNLDQGPQMVSKDEAGSFGKKNQNMDYKGGDINVGKSTAFGYQRVDNLD